MRIEIICEEVEWYFAVIRGGSFPDAETVVAYPSIDVFETKDTLFVEAELAGVRKENVELFVYENLLIIMGRKIEDKGNEKRNYYCAERCFGRFQRVIELPYVPDPSQIKAIYRNGVMIITIPKVKEPLPIKRKISIEED